MTDKNARGSHSAADAGSNDCDEDIHVEGHNNYLCCFDALR